MAFNDVSLLAQEIKEAMKIPKEQLQILRNLNIQLRSPVLPQHQIESRAGSRPLTYEEIQEFEKYAFIKRGSFHPIEDKIICDNWKEFCKLHNWNSRNVQPFLLLREGSKDIIRSKKQRRRFVQFLADGLPHRTLYSIYHRFRNLYGDRLQGRFLPDEDRMILDHLEHNEHLDEKRKYADLAKVLNRTRASIWRRYKLLQEKRIHKKLDLK